MKHFTFYDLYWKLIKNVDDTTAGRLAKAICMYVFCDENATPFEDATEAFIWSNIEDILERTKQLEAAGKTPKSYNKKMAHVAFLDSYFKAMKLMTDEQSGAYLKALCGYMFDGIEPKKLKPPVDTYYDLAKTKLALSKVRIMSGQKGGKAERVKVTDEQINEQTDNGHCVTFKEFMRLHPNVQNDLYASRQHLLKGVDWALLDIGLDKHPEFKKCNNLYQLLAHRKEILDGV